MTWKLVALIALAACQARLGGDDNGASVDANNGSGSNGTKMDAAVGGGNVDAPPQNAACPNGRKLYLHFDGGITLADAAASNSAANQAAWLTNASAAIPQWRPNSGTRAADIQFIVDGVKSRLAATPIEVVTTRPASGPYVMVVFGGYRTNDGGTVGTIYSHATGSHDCGDVVKSDVGWVAERASDDGTLNYVADLAIGSIGWGLGLNGTTDPTDCMCGWTTNCNSAVGACTLSANIASSIGGTVETACPNQNPQNEVAAFSTKFCQ